MNQVQVFTYQGSPVEFEIVDGAVYADATAMCRPFGKRPIDWMRLPQVMRYAEALKAKCDNLTSLSITRKGGTTGGGSTLIHEKLILKLAQWLDVEFEIWCDEQVARLLRSQQPAPTPYNLPRTMPEALRLLAAEMEAKETAERQLAEARPMLEHYQQVMDADGTYTVAEVAKMIGAGPNKLFAFLRDLGVMYKVREHNVPKQPYVENGWFRVRQTAYKHGDRQESYPKLFVTPKGVDGIRKKWTGRSTLPPACI